MIFSHKTFIAGILTLGILTTTFTINNVQAADPDAFIVEVVPSSCNVNEAVDLTIKATDANGEIIKEYQGDVFIEIEGIVDTADYIVPSDGLYTFLPEDQWVKLFSKWLAIKKSGTFTIKVSDIINDTIVGKRTVIVWSTETQNTTDTITIISPIIWGIEKNNIANVMANAPTLQNAPYQIYVNNTSVAQWMTTVNGEISAYVSGIEEWENILQIRITNANNQIIGESPIVNFQYEPIKDGVFNSIKITPTWKIKQWDKISIEVNTSESVTSAKIKVSDGKSLPLEKTSAGIFKKEVMMDTKGNLDLDIDLIVLWQTKSYTWVAKIIVEEGMGIGKIRLYADSIDKSKLNVTWEALGNIAQYKINYGTSKNNLDLSVVVKTKEIIIENLIIWQTYYFQITPLDENGTPSGTTSEITEAKIGEDMSCVVVGIQVSTGQIGDKYYLIRSAVNNIEKYVIYRSEFATTESSHMQKIGETTGTTFEYPFNKLSKKEAYAYYLIEWICKDGTTLKIDSVKKIVVGPTENIILIILISLFGYVVYKLYGFSKN